MGVRQLALAAALAAVCSDFQHAAAFSVPALTMAKRTTMLSMATADEEEGPILNRYSR
jgi:hypothetical protein